MSRRRRRYLLAGLLLGLRLAAGTVLSAAEEPRSHEQLLQWAEGPVQWLLLPPELRELRRAESAAEAVNFVERFWGRRDPDPRVEGNPFRQTFFERVEAADLLYSEDGVRGSLTDRGRALILLGSPHELRVTSRQALDWSPRRRRSRGGKVVVRELPMEVWVYRVDELHEVLAQALSSNSEEEKIELVFVVEPQRTHLRGGEEHLELAARVALARPH